MVHIEPGGIAELIETGQFEEGVDLEAKKATTSFPKNAWQSVSAFANTFGGVIVLGLEETNGEWRVSGVSNPDQMIQDIHNLMRNRQKVSHEVSRNGDIWREAVGEACLVVVRVRRAPRRERPIFIDGDRNQAFVRRNEGDARCTDDELDRIRREATSQSSDMRVVPFLSLDDFEMDAVNRYREMSEERRPLLPHHQKDTKEYLRSIGAWRQDRETREEGPTVAGILMFGDDLAIREIRANHVIDYRRIPADETPTRRWTDRVRWTGHLFGAWQAIFPRLIRGLSTPFRLRGPQRLDLPAGQETLREAFVNMLVHTDYQELSDATIFHRDDGYLFRNPGDSWVDVQDLGIQSESDRRNPIIAQMFDNIGLADQAGSGFIRILDEWRELGYRTPNIVSDPTAYEFELDLSLADMLSAEDRRWLSHIGGPWKEVEELVLVYARHFESVDNQTLRGATGQHLFDISQTLRSLRDRGYLILHGSGRNAHYVLGPAATIGHTGESTGHTGESTGHTDIGDESDLRGWLRKIAEPVARSTRALPDVMLTTIVELCDHDWLSTDDLVQLLNCDAKTVRRYLNALLEAGILERLHEQQRHPHQRYRTASKALEPSIQRQLDL